MKVCYLTPEYPPLPSGGIGTSIALRARALVAAGHEVVVVGPGATAAFDDHGVQVRFDPVTHPPKLGWAVVPAALQRRVRRLVEHEGIDLVVAPDWLGLSGGVHPGCPVLVECNGSATYFGDELQEPVRPVVRWAERRAMRGADRVTAVSRHVADRSRHLFGLADAVEVVNNGVEVDLLPEGRPDQRDPELVLHVGTIVRKKGLLDVAAAFAGVHQARPQSRLEVVGPDAPDARTGAGSTWELVAQRLGPAADATRWHGRRPHDEVGEAYRRAALLLAPSHAEAQPMVWLEAMATGLPVVAYDLPWAREVVVDGETGLLVPPGDVDALRTAVLDLLHDPGRRRRLGHAAAERVRERFSTQLVLPRLVAAYEAAATTTATAVHP